MGNAVSFLFFLGGPPSKILLGDLRSAVSFLAGSGEADKADLLRIFLTMVPDGGTWYHCPATWCLSVRQCLTDRHDGQCVLTVEYRRWGNCA